MNFFFELSGVLAGLLVTGASFPQLLQTYKTKQVDGLSYNTFLVWALGAVCWVIYGAYLGSVQMVVFNAISCLCNFCILAMIVKYRKKSKNDK